MTPECETDTAVTDTDLENNTNLVLIGTSEENALVRKMQPNFLCNIRKQIVCSDGSCFRE